MIFLISNHQNQNKKSKSLEPLIFFHTGPSRDLSPIECPLMVQHKWKEGENYTFKLVNRVDGFIVVSITKFGFLRLNLDF